MVTRVHAVSEVVSYIILAAVSLAVFAAVFRVAPRYFEVYASAALEASASEAVRGMYTSASISRSSVGGVAYVAAAIYNGGGGKVTVSYIVECSNATAKERIGGENGVQIDPGFTYTAVYTVNATIILRMTCYVIVDEGGALIYRVPES